MRQFEEIKPKNSKLVKLHNIYCVRQLILLLPYEKGISSSAKAVQSHDFFSLPYLNITLGRVTKE